MKIEAFNLDALHLSPEIHIEHNNEKVIFSITSFSRENFKKFDIFYQINMYFNSLPLPEQNKLFSMYSDMRDTFDNVWNKTDLSINLNKKVIAFTNEFKVGALVDWIMLRSDIIIPRDFEVEYVYSIDNHNSRDRTYLRSDYTQLVALSLIMRAMIPIFGEFISRIRQDAGNTFKEYYAFQLLNNSNIIEHEVVTKLILYIDLTVGAERNNQNTVIDGINSEEFTTWLLSLVGVRRLSVGDIRGIEPRVNLVTFMHKFITEKVNSVNNKGASSIRSKDEDERKGETEPKLSKLERYKIKMPISIGEILELEHSVKDLRNIAFKLSANMTNELFEKCQRSSARLLEHDILEPQMTLLRWVFKPIISPIGIKYLPKEHTVKCLGVCQAVLWARGHEYLSLLSTSYVDVKKDMEFITSLDTRARVPKELTDEINILYPYSKRIGSKKIQSKPINLAIHSIDRLVTDLTVAVWDMTADTEYITKVFSNGHTRRITINHDIRILLAKLVIEIAKRDWK